MVLSGNTVSLRALEPGDLEILYKWENDTSSWLVSGTLTPFSRHVLTEYIANSHVDVYASRQLRLIIENSEHKAVGCIDIFEFDPKNQRAGVGILIGEKDERKRGYAGDALETLVRYAFSTLNLHQLFCHIAEDNEDSLNCFLERVSESQVKKKTGYTTTADG